LFLLLSLGQKADFALSGAASEVALTVAPSLAERGFKTSVPTWLISWVVRPKSLMARGNVIRGIRSYLTTTKGCRRSGNGEPVSQCSFSDRLILISQHHCEIAFQVRRSSGPFVPAAAKNYAHTVRRSRATFNCDFASYPSILRTSVPKEWPGTEAGLISICAKLEEENRTTEENTCGNFMIFPLPNSVEHLMASR
jgi:hypothetical protein